MYNMDETQLNAKKKPKVVCLPGQQPLVTSFPMLPHLTGMITVNGHGWWTKPVIILPGKKTIRGIDDFSNFAYFTSSTTGWVTKNIYRYYALTFVSEVSFHRLRMNCNLRD